MKDIITDLTSPDAFEFRKQLFNRKSTDLQQIIGIIECYLVDNPPTEPLHITYIGCGLDQVSRILLSKFSLGAENIAKITNYDPCSKTLALAQRIAQGHNLSAEKLSYTNNLESIEKGSQHICIADHYVNFRPDHTTLVAHFESVASILKKKPESGPAPLYIYQAWTANNHSNAEKRYSFFRRDGTEITEEEAAKELSRMAMKSMRPHIYVTYRDKTDFTNAHKEAGLKTAKVTSPVSRLPDDLQRLLLTEARGGQADLMIHATSKGKENAMHVAAYCVTLA